MEKEQEDLESLPFETSPECSPHAISPLNDIEELEGAENMLAGAAICRRIPTGKGREFEVQRLKDSRRNALLNLTEQMNKVRPLLLSLTNVEQVSIESQMLDQVFSRLQEVHERYTNALTDDHEIKVAQEWFDTHDKDMFIFKQCDCIPKPGKEAT